MEREEPRKAYLITDYYLVGIENYHEIVEEQLIEARELAETPEDLSLVVLRNLQELPNNERVRELIKGIEGKGGSYRAVGITAEWPGHTGLRTAGELEEIRKVLYCIQRPHNPPEKDLLLFETIAGIRDYDDFEGVILDE